MALNGGGRPPAQGGFIPLDGNQKKWENEALRAVKSPGCDVSVYNFTGNQLSVKGVGTLASGTALPSSRALLGVGATELLSPGHCCCMTHSAGIRACSGPVSIQPFLDLSVGDGSGPSIVPCWIAQCDTCRTVLLGAAEHAAMCFWHVSEYVSLYRACGIGCRGVRA